MGRAALAALRPASFTSWRGPSPEYVLVVGRSIVDCDGGCWPARAICIAGTRPLSLQGSYGCGFPNGLAVYCVEIMTDAISEPTSIIVCSLYDLSSG